MKKYIRKESVYGSNEVYTSAVTFLDYALKGLAVLISFAGLMISGWVSSESESFFTFFIGLLITAFVVAFTVAVDLAIIETMKNIISITENAKAMRKLYEQEINEKAENDK